MKHYAMKVPKRADALLEIAKMLNGWIGKHHEVRVISIGGMKVPKRCQRVSKGRGR